MRISAYVLAAGAVLVLASCVTTTETTRLAGETEIKEGPARVVNAQDLHEDGGLTSKQVEPEQPAVPPEREAGSIALTPPVRPGSGILAHPSATVADEAAARAREKEAPLFEARRKAEDVDQEKAQALLREMKERIEKEQEERARRVEQLPSQVQGASVSKENREKAQKKFEQGEKFYSQKKHREAVTAYREVLELVPMHKEARERLTQCYADMEAEGKRARILRKPGSAQEVLLLEQKFSSAIRLYDEGSRDEAFKKFKEVVEMIEWSTTRIDTKNILGKAREYIDRINIENELARKSGAKKDRPQEKKPQEEKKAPEQPEEPKKPEPGDVAPY